MSRILLFLRIFTLFLIVILVGTVVFILLIPRPVIPLPPRITRITLAYSPKQIIPNETVTMNGTLEYIKDPWEPLPNRNVNFYWAQMGIEEWNPIGATATDKEGQFKHLWTVNLPLGEYVLKATYLGEEGFEPCETTTMPVGLLVIPENQTGTLAILTCMLTALLIIGRKKN